MIEGSKIPSPDPFFEFPANRLWLTIKSFEFFKEIESFSIVKTNNLSFHTSLIVLQFSQNWLAGNFKNGSGLEMLLPSIKNYPLKPRQIWAVLAALQGF